MNNVLIYSPKNRGGVARVAEQLCEGLNSLGVKAKIAFGLYSVFVYILRNGTKDTVYIGSLKGGIFSLFFSKSVYILHGFPSPAHYGLIRYLVITFATKFFSYLSSYTVAVSALTKMVNELFLGIKCHKVIYNSYSLKNFEMCGRKKIRRIIYVGRLINEKRVLEILEAFKLFQPNYPDYKLLFVGDGPCKSLITKSICGFPVDVIGPIHNDEQLNELYSCSEIFISLNEGEPFGIVFLEAMHHKLKIIAPLVGGQREFIPNEYPAVFIPEWDNPQAILVAMVQVASLPNVSDCSNRVKNFTPERMAKNYIQLFK